MNYKFLNEDAPPMEPVNKNDIHKIFNGSLFLCVPVKLLEARFYKEVSNAHFDLLCIIMSRYDWANRIPPTLNNDTLAEILNVKKVYVEYLLSTLKKMNWLVIYRQNKIRYLKFPEFEKTLKHKQKTI